MSEYRKSPYKEVGVSAWTVAAGQPKAAKAPKGTLKLFGGPHRGVRAHSWDPHCYRNGQKALPRACRRCGAPEFAAAAQCHGKRSTASLAPRSSPKPHRRP